jgi:hypothetical protein
MNVTPDLLSGQLHGPESDAANRHVAADGDDRH